MRTNELIDRLTTGGQEALDRVSQELLANPVTSAALARAAAAKQRMDALGESALGQLHLPTAEDLEEVAAKVRAVATRAERTETTLARIEERLERIEARLEGREAPVLLTSAPAAGPAGPDEAVAP